MTDEQLSNYKDKIKERLAEIEQKSAELRIDLLESAGVLPTILQDPMAHAKEEGDLGTRIEIHERLMKLRSDLRFALDRLSRGTFGACDDCGDEIDPRRLEIQPSAAMCIECQRLRENEVEQKPNTLPVRSGIWDFLKTTFSSPDLDYARFERLERKRSRHEIERERTY